MTPEESARETIDELLHHAGWAVQDRAQMNLFDPAHPGVAVREAHLATGFADYLLFVDGKALAVNPGHRRRHAAGPRRNHHGPRLRHRRLSPCRLRLRLQPLSP